MRIVNQAYVDSIINYALNIYHYGSFVYGTFRPGKSDYDFIVIVPNHMSFFEEHQFECDNQQYTIHTEQNWQEMLDRCDVDASGALVVENATLDKSKEMVTLPFAASDGNIIPWYQWKDIGQTEIDEQKIETRIVNKSGTIKLPFANFKGLSFADLIRKYYDGLQRIIRKPVVIEEKFYLSEIDIKNLDYRKPIYLQKYGEKFAIDKVQWTADDKSTVTLVKLPPQQEIYTAFPYTVTTGVCSSDASFGATVLPEPIPTMSKYVKGAGSYWAESAEISFIKNDYYEFKHWVDVAGNIISYDNPYIYDGTNGDITIYANTKELFIIG